jgi:hypothetical protein
MTRTNREVLERNLSMARKNLEGSIRRNSKRQKEDARLVKKFEKRLELLEIIGEEKYTEMFPYE